MRPIRDVRRENLARLVKECTSQAEFARRIGKDKNQVLQWLMEPGTQGARNIGDRSARHIEAVMGRPKGWLDADRENFLDDVSQFLRLDREILHEALTLLMYDEDPTVGGGRYEGRVRADRLIQLYDWVAREGGRLSAVANAEFMAQVESRRQSNGESGNARDSKAVGSN